MKHKRRFEVCAGSCSFLLTSLDARDEDTDFASFMRSAESYSKRHRYRAG